ncbi:MAG: SIMPL domain-containing protein, partial [Candidatus Pacebacteria bacterium]|nr:SIMPL domain-containing protein [Candidatus Paceibacterota bacterium]
METLRELFKNNIVAFGVVISFAWVVSSFVLASGLSGINKRDTISVTGTAERVVDSDAAKWTFSVTRNATPEEYPAMSKQIKVDQVVVEKYLLSQGIEAKDITLQPVTSSVVCQSQSQVMYDGQGRQQCSGYFTYSIKQIITVDSLDVKKIYDLSLNTENILMQKGVQIQNGSVDFFYTKLADLRVDLLSMASKNAKERAVAIAKSTGDSIGGVKDASQGVFQVTQKNSTDVSDYGSYDTST